LLIQRWVGSGGLQSPYHPGSHGDPSKFSIEISRRKTEEEEGGRMKKRNESPHHPILDSSSKVLIDILHG
jgi:hypothetical protein